MSMTMFGVKAKEGKEGKKGQPSIGLIYRNPIAKIGFLQLILICVQLDNSLEQLLKKILGIECWDGVILRMESEVLITGKPIKKLMKRFCSLALHYGLMILNIF